MPCASLAIVLAACLTAQVDPAAELYSARIAAAHAHSRLGEAGLARAWLDRVPAAERAWEWRYLDTLTDQSVNTSYSTGSIPRALDLAPAGDLAALGLDTGLIILFDPETGVERGRLEGHTGIIYDVRFSPDGSRLISASRDRTARLWSIADGSCLRTFSEHKFPVATACFAPDGKTIASCSYFYDQETPIQGQVLLWNAETGEVSRRLSAGRKPISCSQFSPDGSRFACGTWDSIAVVWSLADPTAPPLELGEAPGPDSSSHFNDIAFSPDSKLLAAAVNDRTVRIWSLDDGSPAASIPLLPADGLSIAFSPDGTSLASGGADDTIRTWSTADWSPRDPLFGHTKEVRAIAWRDSGRLLSASADGTVRHWTAAASPTVRVRHTTSCYSVRFSPDDSCIASAGYDGTVLIWDSGSGEQLHKWNAHAPQPTCWVAYTPDGTSILSCSWDKTLRLWDIATEKELAVMTNPAGVAMVAISPDGTLAAAALTDSTIALWDLGTRTLVRTLTGHTGRIESVAFSPDGSLIASGSHDNTARVWRASDGICLHTLSAPISGAIYTCDFDPAGSRLITAGADGQLLLWDLASRRADLLLRSDEPVYRAAIHPDGSRIIACTTRADLIDPVRGGSILSLIPHGGEAVWAASFSHDGSRLATNCWDGSIVIMGTIPRRDR